MSCKLMVMGDRKPYAVQYYRDKLSVFMHAQRGVTLTEGYFTGRERYASREAAQKNADYHNAVGEPVNPARVIDTRDSAN